MKKLLALMLMVAMMLAFGIVSSATEAQGTTQASAGIATINGTSYNSLAEAISSAKDGETIVLNANVSLSERVVIDKSIILDGNSYTLTSTADRAINVACNGSVTIKNLTINTASERAINVITSPAVLTIENVNATAGNYAVNVASSAGAAKVTIKNSDLTGLNVINIAGAGSEIVVSDTKLTCVDNADGENYAALMLNKSAVGASIVATNITFDIKGDSVKACNGAENATITIDDSSADVKQDVAYISYGDYGYSFATIEEALKSVKNGETIILLADCTMAEVVELRDIAITIEGEYTLTLNDKLKVFGETTLNIKSTIKGEIWLDDGTILKDSYINGDVFVAGNVTFRGKNSVNMLYDFGVLQSNYGTSAPMAWTVERGASLEIRANGRYGLGYGDNVTIFGSIEDALTARESLTEGDVAFFANGLVAQESAGWNKDSYFTVQDAYVVIGKSSSFGNKPGNYGGNYSFAFNNTVLDASRITFYEAKSKTELSFTSCDVVTGTFMTRDADSAFILTNTKLLSTTTFNGNDEGNYNEGVITLVNSILTYSAQLTNNGTIKLDANSILIAPSIIGTGKFIIDATGLAGSSLVIDADLSGFTGTIEIVGNKNATYESTSDGIVINVDTVSLEDIFTFCGVSSKMDGTGITVGYEFDNEAYALYCEQNGALEFGTHFAVAGYAPIEKSLVEYASYAGQFNVVVAGLTDAHASLKLEMALYVVQGDSKQYVTSNGIEATISVVYDAIVANYKKEEVVA